MAPQSADVIDMLADIAPGSPFDAIRAQRPQARLLKVAAAAAGLCAERVAFLRDGRPLEYTCSVMRADRYQITLDLVRGEGVLRPVRNVVELDGDGGGARSAASQGQNRRRIG